MKTINTVDKLLDSIGGDGLKNILIGNGFSLSHPTLGDCFKWDMHNALCNSWTDALHPSDWREFSTF
ncbi:MAG: hypothetical protein ACOH2E_05430 [Candidatus Paracaedibacter sp.]